MLVLNGIFNLCIGPTAYWSHTHRHVNRLNLLSYGTYEHCTALSFAVEERQLVRHRCAACYCTFRTVDLFPKDRNAIRALGLELILA